MKRNKNIVSLSQDHHFGLLCVWKVKKGIKNNISYERIRKYVNFYWHTLLYEHFKAEEEILFPLGKHEYIDQALREHIEIKELIEAINQVEEVMLLELFADLITKHIRFEERILFPYLEETLDENTLNEVGKKLDAIHHDAEEEYEDEFWKIK